MCVLRVNRHYLISVEDLCELRVYVYRRDKMCKYLRSRSEEPDQGTKDQFYVGWEIRSDVN